MAAMDVAALRPVVLTPDRVPGGLLLSTEAGWNQVASDWRFMLASGAGFGFADASDRLVASGLTVDFPGYAWISMILVTPAWRRQGLATRLMQSCIDALAARRLVPALDASPQGRKVYRRLGFRDAGTSTRLGGDLRGAPSPPARDVAALAPAELAAVAAYDSRSSGTDRTALLGHLLGRLPPAAFVARRNGDVTGFVMARQGRLSAQIGPLVAEDDATALALLARAGQAVGGPVCLDLFDQRREMGDWLAGRGFRPLTRFIRMVLGPAAIVPEDHRTYVIAGPELG
jgi:GNAT superfamily N-acetyltransferase